MLKLSVTSALVQLWTGKTVYRSPAALNLLEQLDLKNGESLYDQCSAGFPYAEVIRNRKYGVLRLIRECISRNGEGLQVVIAGAGLDALGIELVSRYDRVRVFELDRENMAEKARIAAALDGAWGERISFVTTDLLAPENVRVQLFDRGWIPDQPTLLVMEGISYYLPVTAMCELVQVLAPGWLVMEYLKTEQAIVPERRQIPNRVFGLIAGQCGLSLINRFGREQIGSLFENMVLDHGLGMNDLERMRTGENQWFPTGASGWIEVSLLCQHSR